VNIYTSTEEWKKLATHPFISGLWDRFEHKGPKNKDIVLWILLDRYKAIGEMDKAREIAEMILISNEKDPKNQSLIDELLD
jgi:hypothetical protein